MRETEKRIKAYRAMLPRMRERVVAAISLLAIALATMTSATYAWLVLSQAPEVTGLQTTIAANGNLEIALAGRVDDAGKLTSPAGSAVGDGLLDILDKNLTWGNVINLGDPRYGLDTVVLRPAQLNENKLNTSPLFAAMYGADGRVEELFSDFGYTYAYNGLFKTKDQIVKEGGSAAQFKEYGVRAVSSLKYGFSGSVTTRQETLAELLKKAESSSADAQTTMQQVTTSAEGKAALQSLMDLAGRYTAAEVDETLGGSSVNTKVYPEEIENMIYLFDQLLVITEKSADALADIYNFEIYMRTDSKAGFLNGAYFLDNSNSWNVIDKKLNEKNAKGETIIETKVKAELKQLKADYQTLLNSKAQLEACRDKNNIVYANATGAEDVIPIVNALSPVFDVNSVKINNQTINELKASIKSNIFGALGLLNKLTNAPDVKIAAGILPRLDKFTGAKISGTFSFSIPANITTLNVKNAKVSTTAEAPFVLVAEADRAQGGTTDFKGDTAQAAETYGLVLDFWVRTNIAGSKLTLEGAPVYTTREEPITAMIDGAEKELYTVSVYVTADDQLASSPTEKVVEFDAYIDNGQYVVYDRGTQTKYEALCATNSPAVKEAIPLVEIISELVGYNGVNRVWDDMNNDSGSSYDYSNSTTMGSGSCYVFYPKSADDQEKSIQLLKHLRVAFVSQDGTLLGEGVMDTEHAIEQAGKVTVPLVCDFDNASTTIVNEDGVEEKIYYIADLEANTPTLITSLVYLDGKNLSNEQVLAVNDIQGHMNIQFGTTADLDAMRDPVLEQEQCNITATMTEKDGSTLHPSDDLFASVDVRTKRIELRIEGVEPAKVTAYFQRVINSAQGIRQNEIRFTNTGGDTWTAEYTFTNAGDYILREVVLDGVTYDLDSDPLDYTLSGYAINDLYFEGGHTGSEVHGVLLNGSTYVTTDRYFTADMALKFTRSGGDPASIKGAFIQQDTGNRTTVNFRKEGDTWYGSATVTTSGVYRLERLEVDGDPVGVPENQMLSLNLYVGVTTSIYSDKVKIGLSDEMPMSKVTMSMTVAADDNTQFRNLPPIELVYSRNGLISDREVLRASLIWDGQMYTGEFEVMQSGTYTFYQAKVTINGNTNTLSAARTAPTITVTNVDEVPVYNGNTNLGSAVFSLDDNASFSVVLKDAASAIVDAKVTDKTGNIYYIRGTKRDNEDRTYTFTFRLPMVGNPLSQSGEWTVQELYLTEVHDASGKYYDGLTDYGPVHADDENLGDRVPYKVADGYYDRWWTWTQEKFTGVDNFTITVSSDVQIDILSTGNIDFGGTKDNPTGSFGQTYPLNESNQGYVDVKVTINGVPIFDATNTHPTIKLNYKLDTDRSFPKAKDAALSTSVYGGGYTLNKDDVSKLDDSLVDGYVNFGDGNYTYLGEGVYRLTTQESLPIDGLYVPYGNVEVKVEGIDTAFTKSASTAPTFTVHSKVPTLTINSVSSNPSGARYYTTATPNSKDGMLTGSYNKKIDNFNAVVYMYVKAQGGSLDQEVVDIQLPTVTLGVSGIQSHNGITVNLPGSAPISFAQNATTATGEIGQATDGEYNEGFIGMGASVSKWPTLSPAGEQAINQITISLNVASGVMVPITMPITNEVTINNPLYPVKAHYVIPGEGSGYTIPNDVYPEDTHTVVLPGTQTWTSEGKRNEVSGGYQKVDGSKTYTGWTSSRDETGTGCNATTTTYYQQWTLVETKYESVGIIYSWTNTHKIVGWMVNGVQYAPGATVSINGDTTITAVIETTKGAETSVEDVAVYYNWDFTKNGEVTSKPSEDWRDKDLTDRIDDETNTMPYKDQW